MDNKQERILFTVYCAMYTYLAIGDSLTTGRGSNRGGFVPIYRQMIAQQLHQPVHLRYLAKSGLTCKQIVRLTARHTSKKKIFHANIITVTAGGNDLLAALWQLQRDQSAEMLINTSKQINHCLHELVHHICEIKKSCESPYMIRVFNIYNPIPGIPLLDRQLSQFNRSLYSLERNRHVEIVNIGSLFYGKHEEYLSSDRIHPNQSGYNMMAEAAIQTGLYPL
ncbi:GDSL-type esterase/lipase family protein [Alkalicoccobacillus porphyridii]|uniref:Spore gernimation protein n=1 Tax=Alkalicoccobacillus porphyridii TaxID=2597270 RepID=A0A554A119_9BACI|nr:GDSL-type esterase/lipase family protein [Alkalicoccobacillus porphyridii]TSB47387.1 spore gernimation protein [Alkalicoccobacillus porphyridii]